MIFVTLGTQNMSFIRLLNELDCLVDGGYITEPIIVQAGCTKFQSSNMKILDFLPSCKMHELQSSARFIITHGGVGSILESLKLRKKVIAIPRMKEYAEHLNNHQLEIVQLFANKGYILPCYNIAELFSLIQNIEKFTPKIFESNRTDFVISLKQIISLLLK